MISTLLALFSALPCAMAPRALDSSQARKVLERAHLSVPPSAVDDWQVVGPLQGDSAALLRQGTEVARVAWDPLLEPVRPTILPKVDDSAWADRLKRWTLPSTGIQVSSDFGTTLATGTNPITLHSVEASVRTGWRGWVTVGGGARFERLLSTPPIAIPLGDSIVRPVVDWSVAACGPVVCLEARTRTLPIGAESWLQPRLSDLLVARREGEFWRTSADSGFPGAWETRLTAHLGVLHYSLSRCPGLWNGSIQSLGLRAGQSMGATWGGGLLWTTERMASWAELGFDGFPLPLVRIRKERLRWSPVVARLEWRSFRQFSASLRTTLTIPDPFPLLLPGN